MHRSAVGTLFVITSAAVLISGCADGAIDRADSTVVRDSAGVEIVENGADTPPALRLSAEPVLEIGQLEGAPEYQLHNVRHVTRLSDGTIVIANTGSDELRFYDSQGRHVRTVGGSGAGPGEFESITVIQRLAGDTLLVFDSRNRRVSLFDGQGEYVRDYTPSMPDGQPIIYVHAAGGNGALLVHESRGMTRGSVAFFRDTIEYLVVRGDSVRALPPYPGMEQSIEVNEDESSNMRMVLLYEVPFGRTAYVSGGPNGFYIGSNDTYEVHEYDGTGTLRGIIRSAHVPPQPVTDALFAQHMDASVARNAQFAAERSRPFDEGELRRAIEGRPHSPAVPLYAGLLAAADGGVWIKDYVMPGPEGRPERWSVFTADGRLRGVIDIPSRFTPMYVTAYTVIGVITDDYDVEYVQVYTISQQQF